MLASVLFTVSAYAFTNKFDINLEPTKAYMNTLAEDKVVNLPGIKNIPNSIYSGYIRLNNRDVNKRHLHYLYVEAENSPDTAPTLFWTNGGPGASSMWGLFSEIGPLVLNNVSDLFFPMTGAESLTYNSNSWAKDSNILVVEHPAGVGFSYCESDGTLCVEDHCCSPYNDVSATNDVYEFLLRFHTEKAPDLINRLKNGFYIAGESYGGVYAPLTALQVVEASFITEKSTSDDSKTMNYSVARPRISRKDQKTITFPLLQKLPENKLNSSSTKSPNDFYTFDPIDITDDRFDSSSYKSVATALSHNFKGLMIGNGCVGNLEEGGCGIDDKQLNLEVLYNHGLVVDTQIFYLINKCGSQLHYKSNDLTPECEAAFNEVLEQVGPFNIYNVLDTCYLRNQVRRLQSISLNLPSSTEVSEYQCGTLNAAKHMWQSANTKRAFNVPQAIHYKDFDDVWRLYTRSTDYISYLYPYFISKGIKIMAYYGTADASVPYIGGQKWVYNLKLDADGPARAWTTNGETLVGGMVSSYENGQLFLVSVRGAGHMVPMYKPVEAYAMWQSFRTGYWPKSRMELVQSPH